MESNLQSLLDKIYEEGIQKSKSESDQLLSHARAEAESILRKAESEAQEILEKAKSDSKKLRESTEADLKSAKNQTLTSLQSEISNLVTKKSIEQPIKNLSIDLDFLKDLILKITENWIGSVGNRGISADQLEILIPQEQKQEFESKMQSVITGKLEGLKISGSHIKTGFQILRKDKGYRVDFTEEAMTEFFRGFLRQKTAEWLFKD